MSKTHRTHLRDIRRGIARSISETGLPGTATLSNLVRSKEDNAELTKWAQQMVEAMEVGNRKLEEARGYPTLAKWYSDEELAKHDEVGGPVLARNALLQTDAFDTLAQLDTVYERFVHDSATHRAVMQFWLFLPNRLEEQGFVKIADGMMSFNDPKHDVDAIEHFVYRLYTECLVKHNPQLDYDDTLAQLKQIHD